MTARASNEVIVFDTGKLVTDSAHARVATEAVGVSPVPLALIERGKVLVVGNSNRFGNDAGKAQTLSVLNVDRIGHGDAVIGTISAGIFPREMCVSSDGRTLFFTNFLSDSLQIVDALHPTIEAR